MGQAFVPRHKGSTQPVQQQGLQGGPMVPPGVHGVPQEGLMPQEAQQGQQPLTQSSYVPNAAMEAYNAKLSGNQQEQMAQVYQSGAQAGKTEAATRLLEQAAAQQQQAEVLPQEVEQWFDHLLADDLTVDELRAYGAEKGIKENITENAIAMYQSKVAQDQQAGDANMQGLSQGAMPGANSSYFPQ